MLKIPTLDQRNTSPQSVRLYSILLLFGFIQICGFSSDVFASLLSGRVTDAASGKPLPNCYVLVDPGNTGTVTDSSGNYQLELNHGQYRLTFMFLGFKKELRKVVITPELHKIRLNIELQTLPIEAEGVTILGEREKAAPNAHQLPGKEIRQIPSVYPDVYRSIKILPGVTSNNELSSAYNVRGGNYDENLIYINGHEIYRPFLLRQGQEENLSLINPDMVENLHFYNGSFPAEYGDRMASVLSVNYQDEFPDKLHGRASLSFFNSSLSLSKRIGNINWIGGLRYANPQLFTRSFQTRGNYQPDFLDVQILVNKPVGNFAGLELFFLYARNRFDLTPDNWTGHYKTDPFGYNVRAVEITYDGAKTYSFNTSMLAGRYSHEFNEKVGFDISVSAYTTRELENFDLTGRVYHIPDARDPRTNRELLKTRLELADNSLNLDAYTFKTNLFYSLGQQQFQFGLEVKQTDWRDILDENFSETSENQVENPVSTQHDKVSKIDYFSGFLQDEWEIKEWMKANLGFRVNRNNLLQKINAGPRALLTFMPSRTDRLILGYGYYYQPPFYYELRNIGPQNGEINPQLSVHYSAGWKHLFENRLELRAESFYKDLKRINPFYLDQLKLVYLSGTQASGYAYGFDIGLQGELVEGINSWISYSFLNTAERQKEDDASYQRRLLDQRHTLSIFLQDKLPGFPNFQSHVRLLYGSGYLFHPRTVLPDGNSGNQLLQIDWNSTQKYPAYFRVDMGLSARFRLGGKTEAVVIAEVLNVFNHTNVAGYSWFRISEYHLQQIPHVFTPRFLNMALEVEF